MAMKRFLLILLAVYLAASAQKMFLSFDLPYYREADGTGFFWTEDALQYRYAKMSASGMQIPATDPKLQYPEGVEPFKSFTIAMEPVAGTLYRHLGVKVPFHKFIIYFVSFFASLAVFPVGFLAAALWKSRLAGTLAALLYAFSVPAFDRAVGSFIREGFALPLLFSGICLFVIAMQEKNPRRSGLQGAAAGIFIGLSLASWHLSRFYLAQFSLVLFLVALLGRADEQNSRARTMGLFLTPVLLFAGTVPALRASGALLSPGITLGVSALVIMALNKDLKKPVRIGVGAFLLLAVTLTTMAVGSGGQYSHVYDTIASMLTHWGSKPADPSELSMATRLMWVEALTSPSPEQLLGTLLWLFLPLTLSATVLFRLARSQRLSTMHVLILTLFAATTVEYLLMRRVGSFWIFFLAVILGVAVQSLKSRQHRVVGATVLCLVVAGQIYCAYTYLRSNIFQRLVRAIVVEEQAEARVPNWHSGNINLLRWIKADTRADDAFLATMGLSGAVLAYTDRPVVVHSKFETLTIREKYEDFISSLFANEQRFYRFCVDNGAKFFIYEASLALERDSESLRYIADKRDLTSDSPVFLMQFFPERLLHFQLVFQNPTYRVFKVVESRNAANLNQPYQPLYDPIKYATNWPDTSRFDSFSAAGNRALTEALGQFQAAVQYRYSGRPQEAYRMAEQVRRQWPNLPHLNGFICELNLMRGENRAALSACERETEVTPYAPSTYFLLSDAYARIGLHPQSQQARDTAAGLEASMPEQ